MLNPACEILQRACGGEIMNIVVAYDGTLHSKETLRYGLHRAREKDSKLVVLHVFNTNLFIDYEGFNAEEVARRESYRQMEEALQIVKESGSGIATYLVMAEGTPEKEIISYARAEKADMLLIPPRYKSITKNAPCPVAVIPGTLLVPVDSTYTSMPSLTRIVEEAKLTHSNVVLLGIVPVHVYNKWEVKEIERIKKETAETIGHLRQLLRGEGVETKEIMRYGYPDEEIVKVAEEYPISLIVLPERGEMPSELTKAARIILDESDRVKRPILLLPLLRTS